VEKELGGTFVGRNYAFANFEDLVSESLTFDTQLILTIILQYYILISQN
jgi:hypothetical protein